MDDKYLYPTPGGLWAIRRWVEGKWITLVQDSYMDEPGAIEAIMRVLRIPHTQASLDRFFPVQAEAGRCPTLELMELCNVLDPTNPHIKNRKEYGV